MNITDIITEEKTLKKKTFKKAWFTIAVCGIASGLLLLLQLLFAYIMPPVENEIAAMALYMLSYALYLIIPFAIAELILKRKRNNSYFVKPNNKFPKATPLYIFGAIGVGYIINLTINFLFKDWVESFASESGLPRNTTVLIMYFILQTVFPAILEEMAFRGVILKNLLPYGKGGAIIISSILFGATHITPPQAIFATGFGILLGICYEKTRSLIVPMIIHFINNSIAVLISYSDGIPSMRWIMTPLSLIILAIMACGFAFIIVYSICGVAKKKYSINKPAVLGYRLSIFKYIPAFLLNFGTIFYMIVFATCYILFY